MRPKKLLAFRARLALAAMQFPQFFLGTYCTRVGAGRRVPDAPPSRCLEIEVQQGAERIAAHGRESLTIVAAFGNCKRLMASAPMGRALNRCLTGCSIK